jgi:Rrf2 family iron-sulfur cluster assembly transcriptional regulator
MLDLAIQENDETSLSKISEVAYRQSIPAPYLEQIFNYLRKAEILTAERGPNGAFKLARSSKEIMIGEIINAVERNMDATQCSGEGICNDGSKCLAHNFWMEFNDSVNDFLMTKSLDDVIANRRGSVKPKDELLIATG